MKKLYTENQQQNTGDEDKQTNKQTKQTKKVNEFTQKYKTMFGHKYMNTRGRTSG